MKEALTHFIKGCEYAEAGNYSGATTEFEIAGQIMGKTSDGVRVLKKKHLFQGISSGRIIWAKHGLGVSYRAMA
ncbi:MAG: hypothetical protein QMC89_03380, partial [Candidatus Hodarchaeaceae archaeon]|nr:hypothetical protein [Candidatus Hodarchaeaceae archaeon]